MKSKLFSYLLILLLTKCLESNLNDSATVALYSGEGCWEESIKASKEMFQWMGYTVKLVSPDFINNEGLDGFRILCIPGGNMYQYAEDLSLDGKKNIRNFIHSGGSYIGICGGAYFASEKVFWRGNQLPMTSLALYKGMATGPIEEIIPYPDYGMCRVNIVDSTHFITQSEQNSIWILYYWGPALTPDENTDIDILGRYNIGSQPMMLAFNYNFGRVFLIGTHPEIEEDSNRDRVDFADELEDKGSDWDLMRRATEWCLGE